MKSTRYLSVQEVIAINVTMIQRYSPGEPEIQNGSQASRRFYG